MGIAEDSCAQGQHDEHDDDHEDFEPDIATLAVFAGQILGKSFQLFVRRFEEAIVIAAVGAYEARVFRRILLLIAFVVEEWIVPFAVVIPFHGHIEAGHIGVPRTGSHVSHRT